MSEQSEEIKEENTEKEMNERYEMEINPDDLISPLLRLSPPPSDGDYLLVLDETEGACDMFDIGLDGQAADLSF